LEIVVDSFVSLRDAIERIACVWHLEANIVRRQNLASYRVTAERAPFMMAG